MAENEQKQGSKHLITRSIAEIAGIFKSMGFAVAEGPEIETEHNNFDALNVPPDHPARDMQDTFWLKPESLKKVLRTHTSPVQIRYMDKNKPPLAIISPGKCYRNEATDATHEAEFYQFEGLMIGESVSLKDMVSVLERFFEEFLGKDINLRLRPSYFPFVEPGVEVDMSCFKCAEKKEGHCSLCKNTGWIELMGAGMVHPNVLRAVEIDSGKWQGFAFGMGIERLLMLRYGIDDIRLFHSGDLRFVNQF